MTTVVDENTTLIADMIPVESQDADTSERKTSRVTHVLKRYEVVIAAVGAIVLIVRLAGGGFISHLTKSSGEAAPAVAPFTGAGPDGATGNTDLSADVATPALPPAVQAALPAGPLPASIRQAFTPSTVASARGAAGTASSAATATGSTPAGTFEDGGKLGDSSVLARVAAPGAPTAVAVGSAGDVWVGTDNSSGQGAAGASV